MAERPAFVLTSVVEIVAVCALLYGVSRISLTAAIIVAAVLVLAILGVYEWRRS